MCDALSRNLPKLPKELETIVGHCLAHSRRRFVEVTPNFPEECRLVLERFREIYLNDAAAREQNLNPEQRLAFHQTHSGPVMEQLKLWLKRQFEEKEVEPNSGLGVAITYLLKHWDRLTLFLRRPGAPLDNNIAQRGLKKAILHRKNSLFYKTRNGARMGDLFMSLIHSCELCDANPFDYLTELQRHVAELKSKPSDWMPWNYRDTLQCPDISVDSGRLIMIRGLAANNPLRTRESGPLECRQNALLRNQNLTRFSASEASRKMFRAGLYARVVRELSADLLDAK